MSNGFNVSSLVQTALTMMGTAMGGPIGAMAAQMFTQIAGQAMQQAVQQAGSQMGLPQPQIDQALDSLKDLGGMSGNGSLDETMNGIKDFMPPDQYRDLKDSVKELMENTRQAFTDSMNDLAANGKGTSKARGGKGDFFTAMAQALGKALQKQADLVQDKANELSGAVDAASGTKDDARADAQNKIMELQTELSSESMRLNYMSTGIQTALAKVGESLSTLGRAQ